MDTHRHRRRHTHTLSKGTGNSVTHRHTLSKGTGNSVRHRHTLSKGTGNSVTEYLQQTKVPETTDLIGWCSHLAGPVISSIVAGGAGTHTTRALSIVYTLVVTTALLCGPFGSQAQRAVLQYNRHSCIVSRVSSIIIIIIIIIMSVFLERFSMGNMLNCAEQVQIQK